jgi:hypothetical protein
MQVSNILYNTLIITICKYLQVYRPRAANWPFAGLGHVSCAEMTAKIGSTNGLQ